MQCVPRSAVLTGTAITFFQRSCEKCFLREKLLLMEDVGAEDPFLATTTKGFITIRDTLLVKLFSSTLRSRARVVFTTVLLLNIRTAGLHPSWMAKG